MPRLSDQHYRLLERSAKIEAGLITPASAPEGGGFKFKSKKGPMRFWPQRQARPFSMRGFPI